ncbi:ribosomal protein S5 domain 2-type protein [Dipodascopsis tothii]|uniref:ribosomal protein S5 domain 2-type protein n=1 Tax=Dipodascopsis tothii TaxID=44089 RepID=UPI0034CE460B
MQREQVPTSINETEFVLRALGENVRMDGRKFDERRPLDIQFGEDYGLVDVRLGKTRVLARISAEIAKPYDDRPLDGLFVITTEMSPMADPSFEAGRYQEEEMLISRLIEKAIRRSQALDTESLCILSGEKCWAIRADIHFLDHDGGLVDACCTAVIAGLLHFKRPDITMAGKDITVHDPRDRVPVPLSVLFVPVCATFSFFNKRSADNTLDEGARDAPAADDMAVDDPAPAVLVDATLQEERLRHGHMTVTANANREICQIMKGGLMPVDAATLLACTTAAMQIAEDVTKLIRRRLEEDDARRGTATILTESRADEDR